jgi:glyoxylase-like metal-dependent hydrolase (beta-lactamase superfamily II)
MARAPATTALDGPLPGGQEGASVRVRPLLAGEMLAPPRYLDRRPGTLGALRDVASSLATPRSRWIWLPIPCFLVEHPGAGPLLVDTGFHPSVLDGVRPNLGALAPLLYRVRTTPEQQLAAQLERCGIALADVKTVVMTHLHIDHASAVSELPDATFVLDRREWAAAHTRGATLQGYARRQFDLPRDWRTIDYDDVRIDAYATFGRSIDLFGDGSVRLLSTPGHTHGHQSLLLRLRERSLLLVGDAAFTRRAFAGEELPLVVADTHLYRRSLGEIRRFLAQEPDTLAIPGHDAAAWAELADLYA